MNMHAHILNPFAYAQLERGLSARQVNKLIVSGELDREDVYRVVPERTFKRRLAENTNLKVDEADAIARLLRVRATAVWAFGDAKLAAQFLGLANPALGNHVPRVMAETDAGAREVEALLHRFVFGDFG
jgi:putative toxin-antitoxin system antitoxin component (TIGR02293 family)